MYMYFVFLDNGKENKKRLQNKDGKILSNILVLDYSRNLVTGGGAGIEALRTDENELNNAKFYICFLENTNSYSIRTECVIINHKISSIILYLYTYVHVFT